MLAGDPGRIDTAFGSVTFRIRGKLNGGHWARGIMAGSKHSGDDLACMDRPVERNLEDIYALDASAVPLCPICQATMRHHANRGTRATFWACSTHPDCRGLRPG